MRHILPALCILPLIFCAPACGTPPSADTALQESFGNHPSDPGEGGTSKPPVRGGGEAPGEGLYKQVFLGIPLTHTIAAVAVLPLVLRSAYLGIQGRYSEHKKIVRFAYPVWLYVGLTGVIVYVMMYLL